jgi:hypothetical protein
MRSSARAQTLQGLVRVRHAPRCYGTGFLVQGEYIVTAAHCLPRWPAHGRFPGDDWVSVPIAAREGGQRAVALIAFIDPVSDLAILADHGSGGELLAVDDRGKALDAFENLLRGVRSLPLRLDDFPPGEAVRVHVYTSSKRWAVGKATLYHERATSLFAEFPSGLPGGTSGAPVIDDRGRVVGVASSSSDGDGSTQVVYLANALPGWMRRPAGLLD